MPPHSENNASQSQSQDYSGGIGLQHQQKDSPEVQHQHDDEEHENNQHENEHISATIESSGWNNQSSTPLTLSQFFPHLSIAPPLPLKLSPLTHLPKLLGLYSTLLQSYQTNATEESRIYQRRQYSEVISETLVDILRECLEFDALNDGNVTEESFLNERYLALMRNGGGSMRKGWLKLNAIAEDDDGVPHEGGPNSEEFSKLQFRSTGNASTSQLHSHRASNQSLFKKMHSRNNILLQQNSDSTSMTTSRVSTPMSPRPLDDLASLSSEWSSHITPSTHPPQTDEELALIRERSEQMARVRAFETAQRTYHHFMTIGKRHLGLILYGDPDNSELLREKVAKNLELILERFEFSIMEIFKKESLDASRNLSREHKLLMDTLTKELLAQRNIGDAMKERIKEILSEEQKNKLLIDTLKKKVEMKDSIITEMREQYVQDTEELREQLLQKEDQQRLGATPPGSSGYDPDDYNLFFLSRADRNIETMLERERAHFQETLKNLKKEYENDSERLIKEKYVALDALKRHLFLDTNFQVFDDIMVPVNVDPQAVDSRHNQSQRDYKHLKVITTQNMEKVRQKYEAMRSMMEQMQSELYKQFDEKEKLSAKVSELYKNLRLKSHASQQSQESSQQREELADLRIEVNKIQLEKEEMEEKIKELMYENQQSRLQVKDDMTQLKSALEKAELQAKEYQQTMQSFEDERVTFELEKQKLEAQKKKSKGTSSQGRLINIKRTSTDAGIQFGSHRVSLSVNHYTKEQQTNRVHVVAINSDDDDDTIMRNDSALNQSKFAQTPRTRQQQRLADNKIQMQQQQTSPRLLKSYVRRNAKQFASLFPKPKTKVSKPERPKSVNFIEKNTRIPQMDDATRQLVDDLIAIDQHNEISAQETNFFMTSIQKKTKKSIHKQFQNAHDAEDNPETTDGGNTLNKNVGATKPRPKTTLPGRRTHYTMDMEHEFHNPTTKVHLADYLKPGDDISEPEDTTNSRLINNSELKPGISIVELIDPKQKKKKKKKADPSRTATTITAPVMDDDFTTLAELDNNMRREHKKIEEFYEKKIELLKEQKRVLQQKLETSTLNADAQIRSEVRHELKEKHAAEISRLNIKLEKAQRQVSIYEQALNKVDVGSYMELTEAVKEAMEMEKKFERMGVREEKLQQETSLRSLYAAVTIPSTKTPANDEQDAFSYEPVSRAQEIRHDMEQFQKRLNAKWKRVITLSRSLSSSKKLSKLAIKQLDAEAQLGGERISDDIRKGLTPSFKPKKPRAPKKPAVDEANSSQTLSPREMVSSLGDLKRAKLATFEGQEAREMPMTPIHASENPALDVNNEHAQHVAASQRGNDKKTVKSTHSRSSKQAPKNSGVGKSHDNESMPQISLSQAPPASRSNTSHQSSTVFMPKTQLQVDTSPSVGNKSEGEDSFMKAWSRNESPNDDSYLEDEESKKMVVALSQKRPQSQSATLRRSRIPSRSNVRAKSTNPDPKPEFVLGPPSLKPKIRPRHTSSMRAASSKQLKQFSSVPTSHSAPLPNKRAHSSLGFRKPLPMNPSIVEAQKRVREPTASGGGGGPNPQHPVYTLQHSDLIHLAKAQQHSNVIDKIFIDQQKQHLFGVGKPNYKMSGDTTTS
uniref:Uncharacterized protein n=1 Tax=Percolomonas cosmopolitus TaxID=63605 RepID=A0A7S1PHU1_9EUKA